MKRRLLGGVLFAPYFYCEDTGSLYEPDPGGEDLVKTERFRCYFRTPGGWLPLQSGFEASIKDALADGASEESLQKLAQIQENICSAAYYEEAITDILADETSYLFAGARTVEETAERIDQRVQLYLTEQWG